MRRVLILTSKRVDARSGGEIFLVCSRCGKPGRLPSFGIRRMPGGELRNQPQCRPCRRLPAVRLSKTQREHLAWVAKANVASARRRPGANGLVGVKRGSFHANQVTHDALVRRGLMTERKGYTFVTKAGLAVLKAKR